MKVHLLSGYDIGKYFLSGLMFSLYFFNLSLADPFYGTSKAEILGKGKLIKSQSPVKEAIMDVVVSGTVVDNSGEPIPGVTVSVSGTSIGTATDLGGQYSFSVPEGSTIVFSFIGFETQSVEVGDQSVIDITLSEDMTSLDEVVVVGYGTQKKSDITGAVGSVSRDRLEMVPNTNIAQAIQGSIPGAMVQTSSAGAAPDQSILIRGRNSIKANNDPLVVLDGIPYGGNISDINPNDVESIEILKDASSAAIYGSRGANGVILVTSKTGVSGKAIITYDGNFSTQKYANLPDLMTGAEFYKFKMDREPNYITQTESDVYGSGQYTDWVDLATRTGTSQQHNLSASGAIQNITYYIAGSILDVKGVQVNDNFKRYTGRINVDSKINDWLTLGTRTQLSFDDQSGASPSTGIFRMNPLTRPYDTDGKLTIYPWQEDIYFENPLEETLFDNKDVSYQVVSNNFVLIDFPFVPGLSYRANLGIRETFNDFANYAGRNTATGFEEQGLANTNRSIFTNTVMENILSYNRDFRKHSIFATAVYSFEENKGSNNQVTSRVFPHDFLSWYSAAQAEIVIPNYSYNKTVLLSQMIRLNYNYDSRYLVTLTSRRDGYSGFGTERKWGIFPSVALGWNIAHEGFFSSEVFSELKLRASWGLNGNQAVDPYETISRLGSKDIVAAGATLPGYIPSILGQDNLSWESSSAINIGLDFGLFQNRISGDINLYRTNTTDLLLSRTISPVHGIPSITQNIGETENKGLELFLTSTNINSSKFKWTTSGNASFQKNRIVSLYGIKDENGEEIDDVLNRWFIDQPIRVNYGYKMEGVWQLDEVDEASGWGSKPGYVKIQDVNGDNLLNADDMRILGHLDPSFLWGLTNTFSYGNFNLNIFIHGVHGVTKSNELMADDVYPAVRRNTNVKNWWTPDNPTNDFYMNHIDAGYMAGINIEGQGNEDEPVHYYENASFVRLKDVSLSYDFPKELINKADLGRLRLYVAGRNLYTATKWKGLDPELVDQRGTPLQQEYVVGLNLSF